MIGSGKQSQWLWAVLVPGVRTVPAPGGGLAGWDPGAMVLPGHQTCLVQGEGAPGAGTHWGHPLPQPRCLSFPAAEQAGSVRMGQSQGEFIQKCEGRMDMNQSSGCEHWVWLSPGRLPAMP